MAEVVHYRVEKTLEELNTLMEIGLLTKKESKEIISKRQDFEYSLRKRSRSKLDYLRYIKYEINLLDAIEKYRNKVIKEYKAVSCTTKEEELERKIILLNGKRLNGIIRQRAAHISRLFTKLATTFQFDKDVWLAYIDFAKRRKWYSRTTALYWRVLRVQPNDENLWIDATKHEVQVNKAYDVARGLFLRALRHFPKSVRLWSAYFNMEVNFISFIHQRALVLQKQDKESEVPELEVDDEKNDKTDDDTMFINEDAGNEQVPNVKAILEDNSILSGELPKVVLRNALQNLDTELSAREFVFTILSHLVNHQVQGNHNLNLCKAVCDHVTSNEQLFGDNFVSLCHNHEKLKDSLSLLEADIQELKKGFTDQSPTKKQRVDSNVDKLDECFGSKGIEETRKLFDEMTRFIRNQNLDIYKTMIELEYMVLMEKKGDQLSQVERIRQLFEIAVTKFGSQSVELWIQYLRFEYINQNSINDLTKLAALYQRAQLCLKGIDIVRLRERYALISTEKSDQKEIIKFD